MTEKTDSAEPRLSHARDYTRPGFYAKLVLMALINAFGLYGIMVSVPRQQWLVLGFLAVTLLVADYVYFSKRAIPAKYLLPGLVFLLVYQVYVMGSTAWVAFTNYGDGHNDSKQPAITQILKASDRRVEGTSTYPVTVVEKDGELGFAVVRDGHAEAGTQNAPLAEVQGAVVAGTKVTEVPGWNVLSPADVQARQKDVLELRVNLSDDPTQGWLRTDNASFAYVAKSALTYDAAADTFTDPEGKVYHADESVGAFVASDGSQLTPGWRVFVGTKNFTEVFNDSRLTGPFLSIMAWTFAFAILSVLTTFALGLALAVIYNDKRVRGRTFYRAIFLLPYAFPAFLATLVWQGMLNSKFGFINQVFFGGAEIPWLTNGWLAKLSILGVNLWLGFPYMFLVCLGALQSLPGDVEEAAKIDGASGLRTVWSIKLPLVLQSTVPLLIASFAFNFNNFSLIYMLTEGGPNYPGLSVPVGETDILISMVYKIAIESGVPNYGLASAMSIVIFIIVGVIAWLGFRQTKTLEEL